MAQKLDTEALRASVAPSEAVFGTDFIILGSQIYGYSILPVKFDVRRLTANVQRPASKVQRENCLTFNVFLWPLGHRL